MGVGPGASSGTPRPARRGWHVGSAPFWIALGLIALAGLWGNIVSPVARHRRALEEQKLSKEAHVQTDYQQQLQLTRRRDALKNDPVAMEREARRRLAYTRPGETAFVLPDNMALPETPTVEAVTDPAAVRRLIVFRVASVIVAAIIVIQFIVLVDVGKK